MRGRTPTFVAPDSGQFTTVYDAAGQIGHLVNSQAERTTFTYDPPRQTGRRTVQRLAGARATWVYDPPRRTNRITLPANVKSDGTTIAAFAKSTEHQYLTAGVAKILGKPPNSVREWCRHSWVNAANRSCGRGRSKDWMISHDELLRIQREGLLPLAIRKPN